MELLHDIARTSRPPTEPLTTATARTRRAPLNLIDWASRTEGYDAAAIRYLPSPPRVTQWMLDRVGVQPATTTFVDLGCGKGRVVLLAAQRPFRRVVGIEISSELAAIARANLERYRSPPDLAAPIEIVNADVTTVELPDGDILVHLYHPFETPVTEAVLRRLEASHDWSTRRVTIAYLAYTEAIGRVRALLEEFTWLQEARYEQSVRGHYNWLLSTNSPRPHR